MPQAEAQILASETHHLLHSSRCRRWLYRTRLDRQDRPLGRIGHQTLFDCHLSAVLRPDCGSRLFEAHCGQVPDHLCADPHDSHCTRQRGSVEPHSDSGWGKVIETVAVARRNMGRCTDPT